MRNTLLFVLFIPAFFNIVGLFVGFEEVSEACFNYENHQRTNLEYYFLPIESYACKPNGGLLQPMLSDGFKWLVKKHVRETL